MNRRIYLASSWRNEGQPLLVRMLRSEGHEVYDFRNPPNNAGFGWEEIDPGWKAWASDEYRMSLGHPRAVEGFTVDKAGMEWADTCVLLLPCGRSAHLEAGWFAGQGRELFILLSGNDEPELMYRFADYIATDVNDLLRSLNRSVHMQPENFYERDYPRPDADGAL